MALSRRAALLVAAILGCAPLPHAMSGRPPIPPGPVPACREIVSEPGPWPRSRDVVRVVAGTAGLGRLEQPLDGESVRLRFFGAHLFDLLDKLAHEAGPTELDRRRVICAALNAAAAQGAPVVRIWGTLKRTGSTEELDRAAHLLALVLDEDARRERPLRFIVTLLNHQRGYGAPRPEASLDDQDPSGAWSARRIYLEGTWRARGVGQLLERIERLRGRRGLASSPYVLAWELVNELDTHRVVAGGALRGPEAEALRDRFLVPALDELAASFPQPIMLGDLRGAEAEYGAFARGVVAALPPRARARLVWTSHLYAPVAASAVEVARATRKVDLDLGIGAELGLPFVLGELGEHGEHGAGEARFCADGIPHDPSRLFTAVLDAAPRSSIDAALFWGEGQCSLAIPGTRAFMTIGAGGDSADLGPGDVDARAAVRAARALPRFRTR